MSSLGGIGVLIGIGVLAYLIIKQMPHVNQGINPIQNKLIQEDNQIKVQGNVTPSIVTQLQKSIPNLTGSQVTGLIHGGSIQTGYRGTNGKYYSSYDEAVRNNAAPLPIQPKVYYNY